MTNLRYRRIPGQTAAYWFDLVPDAKPDTLARPEPVRFIGIVRRTAPPRWHTRPTWRAADAHSPAQAYAHTRELAAAALIRKLAEATP